MNAWRYRFSIMVVFATAILILAGGLVTSHEAGLAVPDWPLSFGQWFPPMVGNIFWEHGHRMIAGTVGILTFILALWVQKSEPRTGVRVLAWAAFAAVILQALLGGLTVIYLLPPAVSIAHACLAQTFFCLVISLAYFLSNDEQSPLKGEADQAPGLRRLLAITAGMIYLQLIFGAVLRHTGWGVFYHVLIAFLVLIHVLLVSLKISRFFTEDAWLNRGALLLGFMVLFQFFLGIGAFIFTQVLERSYAPAQGEVFFTATHQTLGALILGLSIFLNLLSHREVPTHAEV